ncbi:hypothetical protein CYMTET_27891 [Cymbomonas tetramitiformis]|uniref:Uncharacterized protein n=1 Tax=Cymbomonas tetramitiformis TaxID=36881 RepID=A0AAE0FP04_9CHLO|nr:hypothetical protein CYMTET_27891 [Cymbomonas tetramitiformis]
MLAEGGVDESYTEITREQGLPGAEARIQERTLGAIRLQAAGLALCEAQVQDGVPGEAAVLEARRSRSMLLFHLRDGRHTNGIHLEFQRCMQFDLGGDLMQCSGTALRVEPLAQEFCQGDAGAGGGSASFERPEGAAEAAPGKQAAPRPDATEILHRLDIERTEKKGVWEATQLVEHLGLEVGTADGQLKGDAPQRRKSIYSVTEAGGMAEIFGGALTPPACTGTPSSLCKGPLNLREWARGFWSGNELGCHIYEDAIYERQRARWITHLELESVMLAHFTSRDLALMRRMRQLWILLDLHNIELTA